MVKEIESIKLALMNGYLKEIKSRGSVSRSDGMTSGRCQVLRVSNVVRFIFWGEQPCVIGFFFNFLGAACSYWLHKQMFGLKFIPLI